VGRGAARDPVLTARSQRRLLLDERDHRRVRGVDQVPALDDRCAGVGHCRLHPVHHVSERLPRIGRRDQQRRLVNVGQRGGAIEPLCVGLDENRRGVVGEHPADLLGE
jgi:hypothetical protein